jgi:hypothetical protein
VAPTFRFTFGKSAERLLHQRKVKKSHEVRTERALRASHFRKLNGDGAMRTLGYIVVFFAFLAGPSMAGSPDRDLPGIGTFIYCGSPIVTPAPAVMAAIGQ